MNLIVLNGGSYYPESINIDKEWISHIKSEDIIGFVSAATMRSEKEYQNFFKKSMANFGFTNIIPMDLYGNWSEVSKVVKVIYIAGGNTYKLLNIMKQSRFSEYIKKNHKNKIVIGNSAGAVVLGKNIKTSNSRDIIGMNNTEGLALVNYSICPHYTNDKYKRLKKLAIELNHKVIGIPETSAIIISENKEKIINEISIIEPK